MTPAALSAPGKRRAANRFLSSRGDPNEIITGDCLTVLEALRPEPSELFDLVYVDPPFNAGGRRSARTANGPRINGSEAYSDVWGGLEAFLVMLEPRLHAIHRVMSDRSSLWLHLDHRAVHDAKVRCDGVFGRSCFRGEIIWLPGNGAKRRSGPSITHQTILIYSKTKHMLWNENEPALREPFASTSLSMHFTNRDLAGRRYRERSINGKTYRYYADRGRKRGSVWNDCPAMTANTPLRLETTGYPTQKPESLLERIVRAASLPASRVLDPMCGSGTTLAVAKRLGRRYLGIDQSELACGIARERLAKCACAMGA